MRKPPRWGAALLRRESGRGLWLTAAGTIVVAAAMARAPATDSALPAIVRMRFDMVVLAAVAAVLVLRIAVRVETDHRDGWLLPLVAAGARRTWYGVTIAASAAVASALVFCAAALSLAVATRVVTGSSEPIAALPRILGGGLLLLSFHAAFAGLVAVLLRNAMATVVVVGAAVVLPYTLLSRQLLHSDAATWSMYALTYVAPPILVPMDAAAAILIVGQLAIAVVLLCLASRRVACRIT